MGNGLSLQYIIISLNLAAAILVITDNHKSALNRSFFVFALGAAIWIFCTDIAFLGKNSVFFRPMLCGLEIMVLGFVLLAIFFPYYAEYSLETNHNIFRRRASLKERDGSYMSLFSWHDQEVLQKGSAIKKEFIFFLFPWLIIFILTFSQLIISFADINNDGYLDAVSGILFPIRSVVLLLYVAWGIVLILKKYQKLVSSARIRLFPFVAGAGLFIIITLVCDFFLFIFHFQSLVFVSSFSSLFFIGCTAYAIIRHRFMDIRLIIRRGVVYIAAVFVISLIYFGGSFLFQEFLYKNDTLSHSISGILATVLCVFGFFCLKYKFEKITDKFFFRGEYDYFVAVHKLCKIFSSTINLNDLLGSIGEIISETIKPGRIVFFLDDAKQCSFFDGISRKPLLVKEEKDFKEIIDAFRNFPAKAFSIKELERTIDDVRPGIKKKYRLFIDTANKNNIAMVIPVFLKEKVVMVLLLGCKLSTGDFSKKDNELLSIISHQAGMAIENAMLYAALRRHADELERRVSERTDRIKNMYEGQSRFLADLSHEFQTPISILKGNIECLEKINNEKGKSEFYTIETTLDRLSRLVDNLLNIARLNSSKINLEKRPVNVEKLLEQTYDDCLILARDKGVNISFSSQKCFVSGSADKLKEVLLNLISNALKHTLPGGKIMLSSEIINDEIEIRITDNGSGISSKNLPRIFERFYRIDNKESVGTGLGLYICRQIVEAHGGTITAESKFGEGSCFIIHLPFTPHHYKESVIP